MQNAFRSGGRNIWTLATGVLLAVSPACSSITDTLLEVEDPDLIMPTNVNSLPGARAVANGALGRFVNSTAGGEGTWLYGGLLTDEWSTSSTFIQNDETDQRKVQLLNTQVTGFYRNLNRVRTAANQAIPLLEEWDPTNSALKERAAEVDRLRAEGRPTLPTTIGLELATNPFLRWHDPAIRRNLGMETASDVDVFAEIRKRKDVF